MIGFERPLASFDETFGRGQLDRVYLRSFTQTEMHDERRGSQRPSRMTYRTRLQHLIVDDERYADPIEAALRAPKLHLERVSSGELISQQA